MSALFPVHGWAVSEAALTSAKPATKKSADRTDTPSSTARAGNEKSVAKKRKREELAPNSHPRVTGDDLQRLWNAQFRSETNDKSGRSTTASTNKKKRRKPPSSRVVPVAGDDLVACDDADKFDGRKGRSGIQDAVKGEKAERGAEEKPEKLPRRRPSSKTQNGNVLSGGGVSIEDNRRSGPVQRKADVKLVSESKVSNGKASQAVQKIDDQQRGSPPKLTPLQAKMRGKLTSARFRHLNELLYTSPSSASFNLFASSPDLFGEYHQGFAQQVKDSWPENPVDGYVRQIMARAHIGFKVGKKASAADVLPLPRRKTESCTFADLGCGDAPLARALSSKSKSLKLRFHNFDLHAPNGLVKVADIADLPLRDGEVDVAVFCLSLMGTNWLSFIEEAWRILRGDGRGELWVAEVKSRFGRVSQKLANSEKTKKQPKRRQGTRVSPPDDETELFVEDETSAPPDETDISGFVKVVQGRGFTLRANSVNADNKMFVSMIFTKSDVPSTGKHEGLKWDGHEYKIMAPARAGRKKFIDKEHEGPSEISVQEEAKVLKPCVYKKR